MHKRVVMPELNLFFQYIPYQASNNCLMLFH